MAIPLTERDVLAGASVLAVADLAGALGLSIPEALAWLQISPRTWARRKKVGHLDQLESDRVARLGRLLHRATRFAGGPTEARDWLRTPARALARRTPLEVAATEAGAEEVHRLIGRLEHGVFT